MSRCIEDQDRQQVTLLPECLDVLQSRGIRSPTMASHRPLPMRWTAGINRGCCKLSHRVEERKAGLPKHPRSTIDVAGGFDNHG